MRVLIIDDFPIPRFGIKMILESANIEVYEASSGAEGLSQLHNFLPDLVILKIDLPDLDGFDLISTITQEFPHIKIVVLSQHSDEGLLKLAFNCGATSYLLQNTEPDILLYAIKMSYQGQSCIDPRLPPSLLDKDEDNTFRKGKKFGESLTPIEMKVLKLMACGFSNDQISLSLNISPGSVRGYTNSLNLKLGSQNRAHAVFRAIYLGYINCQSLLQEISNNHNLSAV